MFTSGHIAFRQSLLVRAEDAERIARHGDLTGADRVGALADTTGEARFLELTGIADGAGVLAAGTRVETPHGTAVADGSADYVIDAAGASPDLAGRQRVRPASSAMPTVVYYSDETSLIEALAAGSIDAVASATIPACWSRPSTSCCATTAPSSSTGASSARTWRWAASACARARR